MEKLKNLINGLTSPWLIFTLASAGLFLYLRFARFFAKRSVGLAMFMLLTAFFIVSSLEPNFRKVVSTPDNVPIVGSIFLVSFFVWFSLKKGVENDTRTERGEPTFEKSETDDKVFVMPNLIYIEFLCTILLTILLMVWSLYLKAPLEEPANPTESPNPSKAPWYFLGLQELLVYFDPWIAGVLLPGLIIGGLVAIPYLDTNKKGNGYFTLKERKMAITVFLFGFLIFWVLLIIYGTFLRGPNWNFFGPYEFWDVHKVVPLVNVNLSDLIYVRGFGRGLPSSWFLREIWGFVLLGLYFLVPPVILAKTVFKKLVAEIGPVRYAIFIMLLLAFLSLPVKMYLRWTLNLKYIVALPEFFFNI